MEFRPLAWLRSLHAKLFIVTALVTSALTIGIAYSIVRNSRREFQDYTRRLVVEAAETVETDVVERDPQFKDPRKLEELLESIAGEDRAVFQVDVFQRVEGGKVQLVRSSGDEDQVDWSPDLGSYLDVQGPQNSLVELEGGGQAWKCYLPIANPRRGRPSIGLIRAYCDLERWEDVWKANLHRTYRMLPPVLAGEFILLWVILRWLISDPLAGLVKAMERLEQGETDARAQVQRRDELGYLATRFNAMAQRLQRASKEREDLILEIQKLNTGLQDRIDAALSELQDKNRELGQMVERVGLLREELSQQERLAVAGQLSATFAHEVGTPLNLVNGHLQILQSQAGLPEKATERLGLIHSQIQRVSGIVRRLLDMTRRPQLSKGELHLDAFLQDLQALWAPTTSSHGVQVHRMVPNDCVLDADRKQMEQLFLNLVNNALDAMPEGGVITVSAARLQGPEGLWEIRVADTGQGIPAEAISQVFKPMFTTKPEGKGTGLGLPICREIVRGHGGDIRIESEPGKGTAVVFTLPEAKIVAVV
ncbi:MAG: HAMP domain-containing protein [Acidobacteria bacterium]|nr:HAMP domain-containing protein [Acidobacteriota bacterium]